MDRDRSLLFSLFAVQLAGLEPSSIIEAGGPLPVDSVSLGQRLLARQLLNEHERVLIERLTDEAIRAHGGSSSSALDSFGGTRRLFELFGDLENVNAFDEAVTLPLSFCGTAPDTVDEAAEEVAGRYMPIAQYARGGMGRILLVYDKHMGRNVALKELLQPAESSQTNPNHYSALAARFLQEARVTGQLEHPAIIPVYEVGRRHAGTLYYTMKFVRGTTLQEALRTRASLAERLGLLPHFLDLCQAIAYAHSRQIIHRDIKPANVMIGEFGETVVLDWGLAKAHGVPDVHAEELRQASHAGRPASRTAFGRALGTPHYMSPEQAEGQVDKIDERSDVYSLGAVLYEMLTGRPPFAGETAKETIQRLLTEPVVPVRKAESETPPELAGICEKALQKDPQERYGSARELADEIIRYQSGALVEACTYTPRQHLARFYKRHRAVVQTVLAAVSVVLVVVSYMNVRLLQASQHEHEQRLAAEKAQWQAIEARNHENEARQLAEQKAYIAQIRLSEASMRNGSCAFAQESLWKTEPERRGWEWGYLLAQCNRDLFTFRAPGLLTGKGRGHAVMFSPDDRYVALRGGQEPLRLLDAGTGTPVLTIGNDDATFVSMRFSGDGTRIVTTSWPDVAQIWDADTGQEICRCEAEEHFTGRTYLNFDGTLVALAEPDARVSVWDATSGNRLLTLQSSANARQFFFLPSGRFLLESADKHVTVWASDGKRRFSFDGKNTVLIPGSNLCAASCGGDVHLYDWLSGAKGPVLKGHSAGIVSLCSNQDGTQLAFVSEDGEVALWNPATSAGVPVCNIPSPLEVQFHPDGKLLMVASRESITLWDIESKQKLATITGHSGDIFHATFSHDGTRIMTTSADGTAKIWDVQKELAAGVLVRHREMARIVDFSPDGNLMATIGQDNTMNLIDRAKGTRRILAGHCWSGGLDAAFSPDGKKLAAVQDSFMPVIWDVSTGRTVASLVGHKGVVRSIAYDPRGGQLATGSRDGTAVIWNESGEELLRLTGHRDIVCCVNYSPDGTRLVSASSDNTARVWDSSNGALLLELTGHTGEVCCAVYDPQGQYIATASADKTIRIWHAGSGELINVLAGHSSVVRTAAFSPDARRLVSISDDKTLKIWDPMVGEQFLTLDSPVQMHSARFSFDGHQVYGAAGNGEITIFDALPCKLEELPGTANETWQDRISTWKMAQKRPKSFLLEGMTVLTTKEIAGKRLKQLLNLLQHESPQPDREPGLLLEGEPLATALGQLCLLPGDRLRAVNDCPIEAASSAGNAIATAIQALDTEPPSLSMVIEREGQAIPVDFQFHPIVKGFERRVLPRDELILAVRTGLQMFASLPESLLEITQSHAREIGDVLDGPTALNGLYIMGDSPLGMAAYDKFMSINGHAIRDLDGPRHECASVLQQLESGATPSTILEVQRGTFQTVQLTVEPQ